MTQWNPALDNDVKSVKSEFKNLETNVSSLGEVFDSVKETAEANRTVINNNRKSLEQYRQERQLTEKIMADKMKRMEDANEKLQNSVTDLKARSMRDNLVFSEIPEQRGPATGFPPEKIQARVRNLF